MSWCEYFSHHIGVKVHGECPWLMLHECIQVEDALCLNTLLGQVCKTIKSVGGPAAKTMSLEAAFRTFDAVRRTRTQWLVNSSRRVCDLYHQPEWADPTRWVKAETCFEELRDRSYKIWHFNIRDMVDRSLVDYHSRLSGVGKREEEVLPMLPSSIMEDSRARASPTAVVSQILVNN